jgi:hypothetical protein
MVAFVPNVIQKGLCRLEVAFRIIVQVIRTTVIANAGVKLVSVYVLKNVILLEGRFRAGCRVASWGWDNSALYEKTIAINGFIGGLLKSRSFAANLVFVVAITTP